jgi:hypothetical protein
VSEPLRLLVDQQRVVTVETVSECAQAVWNDEPNMVCVPPAAGQDESVFATPRAARTFVAVLEALQTQHDVVVVDLASLPSLAASALYQVADEVVFVANRDPAGAFAHRQALLHIAGYLRADATLTTVINDNSLVSASLSIIRHEALAVPGRELNEAVIPRNPKAGRWPCSGCTPYQFLSRNFDPLLDARVGGEFPSNPARRAWFASMVAKAGALREVFRLGKRKSAAVATPDPTKPKPPQFPEIGYRGGTLEEGSLVSRPVLLS